MKIDKLIKDYNLITKGDTVAVACSGGRDSICLLHYLHTHKKELGINVIAVNVDHSLREESAKDSEFVKNFCEHLGVKVYMYRVDVNKISVDKKMTIESAGREARYKIFKNLINKHIATKIALGHHLQDQAETILLNIFRGAGLSGASGMEPMRDGIYIRPLLTTSRMEISAYITENELPYVDDSSNDEIDYSRNYIRNMIMPQIRNKWTQVDNNLALFGKTCQEDDEYIYSIVDQMPIICEDSIAKLYLHYFMQPAPVINRLIMKAIRSIGITADIERKHIEIIKAMAQESNNGTKISLPNSLSVIKEYNYITFTNRNFKPKNRTFAFTRGKIDIPYFGVINTVMTRKFELDKYTHLIDAGKLPKDAVWRYRKDGDFITKFGGGTKSLSDYLIDKKVPVRLRKIIPVLASENEIFVIAGVEISDKVKIDENTKSAYGIEVARF